MMSDECKPGGMPYRDELSENRKEIMHLGLSQCTARVSRRSRLSLRMTMLIQTSVRRTGNGSGYCSARGEVATLFRTYFM